MAAGVVAGRVQPNRPHATTEPQRSRELPAHNATTYGEVEYEAGRAEDRRDDHHVGLVEA